MSDCSTQRPVVLLDRLLVVQRHVVEAVERLLQVDRHGHYLPTLRRGWQHII